jgi:hypothetical protein
MKITVTWHRPITLQDASDSVQNLIYSCSELDSLTEEPGVYIFARRFGKSLEPLYVGKGTSLRSRIRQQLNNVRLMRGIQNNPKVGSRVLTLGTLSPRPGQKLTSVLKIVESALIEEFINDDHDLLNKQGTVIRADTVNFRGNRTVTGIVGSKITIPRRPWRNDV